MLLDSIECDSGGIMNAFGLYDSFKMTNSTFTNNYFNYRDGGALTLMPKMQKWDGTFETQDLMPILVDC